MVIDTSNSMGKNEQVRRRQGRRPGVHQHRARRRAARHRHLRLRGRRRPWPPPRTEPPRWPCWTRSTLSKTDPASTRASSRPSRWPAPRASATLLVLSDGADTHRHADRDGDHRDHRGRGPRRRGGAEPVRDRGLAALQPLADGRRGARSSRRTPRRCATAFAAEADVLASQVLVTAQVPSLLRERPRPRSRSRLPTSDGTVTAEAFTTVRAAAAVGAAHQGRALERAVLGPLRGPGRPRPGAGPRRGAARPEAQDRERRGPGEPVHRLPDQVRRSRWAAPRHRCRLRLREGDRGQHAAAQQGPRRTDQPPPRGGRQRAQVVGVAAPPRRHLLRQRPGRASASAAATRSSGCCSSPAA